MEVWDLGWGRLLFGIFYLFTIDICIVIVIADNNPLV